jgi:hypothetical protein
VLIGDFADLKVGDSFCNGYEIKLFGDPRDLVDGRFRSTLRDEHTVLIEMPAVSAAFLQDADEFAQGAKRARSFCKRSQDSDNVLRNNLHDNPDLNKKYLAIRFPEDVFLTADKFYDETSGNRTLLDNIGYLTDKQYTLKGRKCYYTMMVNIWRVGIVEEWQRNIVKRKLTSDINDRLFGEGTTDMD